MLVKLEDARGRVIDAEHEDRGLVGDFYEAVYRVGGREIVSRVDRALVEVNGNSAAFRMCEDMAVLEAHGYALVR